MVINKNQKVYPHEFATWKILPAVKAELARQLHEDGMPIEEVAELFGATRSSIYQYLRRERGGGYELPESVTPMFKSVIQMLKENANGDILIFGVTQICNEVMKQHYGWDSFD